MPSPSVSIVILNYNYAHFLECSIRSALDQNHPRCEVVVVDDCSTDSSRDLIGTFDGEVVPVLQAENRGHGAGMNAGFAASTGDIVIFLDADDYLYAKAARRISENWRDNVVQYQFPLDLVDASGVTIDRYPPAEARWEDGDVKPALLSRGRYATTVTSGLAFSRFALEAVLPMEEQAFRQGGDGYLVTVAPLYGEVRTIHEVLGAYRQHGANHSQFSVAVAKRSRWRMQHDAMRLRALADRAGRLGLACASEPWRNDTLHLQERAASLILEPQEHLYADDTRRGLANAGLFATSSLPLPAARRLVLRLWWCLVGYAPLWLARRAVAWKLQAATRPAFVKWSAKLLRRLTRKTPRPVRPGLETEALRT